MVRVRLKAVILGVEECHPPREARGISVQVILVGLPQAAVRDPRVGDRDVALVAATAHAAIARPARTSALRRVVVGFATSGACGASACLGEFFG